MGFPKKLAQPKLAVEIDTLVGTFNDRALDTAVEARQLTAPNFLLKIIAHVDGTARICGLVRFHLEDITATGARTGPAALDLCSHALQVLSAKHVVADLTVGLGTVVHDYLSPGATARRRESGSGILMEAIAG